MAKATIQSLREQSEKLQNRWLREFAGKPRHSRDLALLEKLVEKAGALVRKAKQIPGEKGDEVEKVVRERYDLYRKERDAIAEVKFDRPEVAEVHRLGIEVDRALAIWRRHFAGRDRRTRDLPLLDAAISKLAKALARLRELAPGNPDVVKVDSLDSVTGQLEVMKDERGEIDKARRALAPADKVAVAIADGAFALDRYRVHLGGQPRAACSLAHLDAVLVSLRRVVGELEAGELSEAQAPTLTALRQNLAAYTAERDQIVKALSETPPRDRGGQLAAVANRLFQIYQQQFAGQSRATRDLRLLSDLNDRLTDVAEQMAALDRDHDEPVNRKNIPVVEERVRRYETEWTEIAKAKAQAAQTQAAAVAPSASAPAAKAPAKSGAKAAPPGPTIRIEPKK